MVVTYTDNRYEWKSALLFIHTHTNPTTHTTTHNSPTPQFFAFILRSFQCQVLLFTLGRPAFWVDLYFLLIDISVDFQTHKRGKICHSNCNIAFTINSDHLCHLPHLSFIFCVLLLFSAAIKHFFYSRSQCFRSHHQWNFSWAVTGIRSWTELKLTKLNRLPPLPSPNPTYPTSSIQYFLLPVPR